MAEFLYAGKNITEKLRNAKYNQNIQGNTWTPGYTKKDPFYLITYITEFLYAGNNTNGELTNAKSYQNIRG